MDIQPGDKVKINKDWLGFRGCDPNKYYLVVSNFFNTLTVAISSGYSPEALICSSETLSAIREHQIKHPESRYKFVAGPRVVSIKKYRSVNVTV